MVNEGCRLTDSNAQQWSKQWLGYEFSSPQLLEVALTHKSRARANNERLEFLGDAVLGMVMAEALFMADREADEGDLSRLRSALVRTSTLAEIALELDIASQLRLGAGEKRSGGHQRRSINADTVEAVIGAVYRDGGYTAARDVILRLYAERLADLPDPAQLKDAKTRLQELLQSRSLAVPEYEVVKQSGPDHARRFEVECSVLELKIKVSGRGGSRRAAEQDAASQVLEQMGA